LPALLALLAPGPRAARAEESASPPVPVMPVETIEVRESAEEPAVIDPTAFATVIRAEDFAHRIVSLADLLRETTGVQVKSLGGEFATLSIRGSSSEQVIVYLDGVPLNRALGGGVNLADLPLSQVETIAVYRGFTPAGLPAASIGGAVLITTRRSDGTPRAAASAAAGSFGASEATFSFSSGRGRAEYTIGGDAARSAGDFRFQDDNGTPHDATDDGWSRRINNDFERGHLAGNATFHLPRRGRLLLTGDLLRRRQGSPGVDAIQSRDARYEVTRGVLRADLEVPGLWGGRLLARGAADLSRHTESYEPEGRDDATDHRVESFGQEAGLTLLASRRQAITFLIARRRDTARLRDGIQPEFGTARRDDLVLVVEDQIALGGDRLLLNPSIRHERYDSTFRPGPGAAIPPETLDEDGGRTTGRVGFRARLAGGWTLKGNAGRFYRIPDFIELFGNSGPISGNPALVPESGRSIDLGLVAEAARPGPRLRAARLQVTLFETLAEDQIVFVGNPQRTVRAQNFGRARIRGVEADLALSIGRRFRGSLNATVQRAVNESGDPATGFLIPNRPSREAGAAAELDLGRSRLFYNFTYVGRNFTDDFNTGGWAIPARYLHDFGVRFGLPRGLEATLEARNLGDEVTYDIGGYPLPGRSLHARIGWRR
jgi:iron complex outermembrane receptor protein